MYFKLLVRDEYDDSSLLLAMRYRFLVHIVDLTLKKLLFTRNLPAGQSGSEAIFCGAGEPRQSPFRAPKRRASRAIYGLLSFHIEFDQHAPTVCQGFARPIYPRYRRGPRGSDTAGPRDGPIAPRAGFRKSGSE